MENETEAVDTQNDQQDDTQTVEQETLSPEEIADLKHKAEVSAQNFERAKKAEAEKKALEAELARHKESPQQGLTAEDVLAFTGEGITNKEDIELAKTWAKNSGQPVGEILSDDTFKTVLGVRQEQRKTALTTQTKGGSRMTNKFSGDELLRRAEKGELPESDEDINKMLDAKFEAKKKALKRN